MATFSKPPKVSRRTLTLWRARAAEHLARGIDRERTSVSSYERGLRRLSRRLHAAYGTPNLGNRTDPTDELVYIILSRKTREQAYQAAFKRLKRVGPWARVVALGKRRLEGVLRGGGLESKKALALLRSLTAVEHEFGHMDLRRARFLPDEQLYAFLAKLPEVGPKSALCIMLYAFARPVFPADAHVGRIVSRLGAVKAWTGDLQKADHKQRQAVLVDAIPPDLRYALHVNLVSHGRTVCLAVRPRCGQCVLARDCAYALAHGSDNPGRALLVRPPAKGRIGR